MKKLLAMVISIILLFCMNTIASAKSNTFEVDTTTQSFLEGDKLTVILKFNTECDEWTINTDSVKLKGFEAEYDSYELQGDKITKLIYKDVRPLENARRFYIVFDGFVDYKVGDKDYEKYYFEKSSEFEVSKRSLKKPSVRIYSQKDEYETGDTARFILRAKGQNKTGWTVSAQDFILVGFTGKVDFDNVDDSGDNVEIVVSDIKLKKGYQKARLKYSGNLSYGRVEIPIDVSSNAITID